MICDESTCKSNFSLHGCSENQFDDDDILQKAENAVNGSPFHKVESRARMESRACESERKVRASWGAERKGT